jgi:RNA polymerase sigma-70 factor (ECF subfamily)
MMREMNDRDADAFRALYRSHYRTVCRYVAVRADAELVEEVAAQVFLVAWRRFAELSIGNVVPWLLNAAGKCLADQRRALARRAALQERLEGAPAAPAPAIEHDLARVRQRHALLAALRSLREGDRELILLRHWDGLRAREIATVLELNPAVARQRLHRAERRYRRALDDTLAAGGIAPAVVPPALTDTSPSQGA